MGAYFADSRVVAARRVRKLAGVRGVVEHERRVNGTAAGGAGEALERG